PSHLVHVRSLRGDEAADSAARAEEQGGQADHGQLEGRESRSTGEAEHESFFGHARAKFQSTPFRIGCSTRPSLITNASPLRARRCTMHGPRFSRATSWASGVTRYSQRGPPLSKFHTTANQTLWSAFRQPRARASPLLELKLPYGLSAKGETTQVPS